MVLSGFEWFRVGLSGLEWAWPARGGSWVCLGVFEWVSKLKRG